MNGWWRGIKSLWSKECMNKEDAKSGDEKCDLMEMYCDTSSFFDTKSYISNITKRALAFMEETTYKKEICTEDTTSIASQVCNIITKYFNVYPDYTIDEKENDISIFIEKKKFAYLSYKHEFGYKYYVVFLPECILKKCKSFDEKLCHYIKFVVLFEPDNCRYLIQQLQYLLSNCYDIRKDDDAEYGYRVVPKYNLEMQEAIKKLAEKEPSLRQVLDFMYAGDYKNALRVLVDDILDKHKDEYKNKIQQGNETLFDIDKLSNFVNNYKIRHSKNRKVNKQVQPQIEPTDEQLKVHLDFGLSIYRLFCIYQDDNDKKPTQK